MPRDEGDRRRGREIRIEPTIMGDLSEASRERLEAAGFTPDEIENLSPEALKTGARAVGAVLRWAEGTIETGDASTEIAYIRLSGAILNAVTVTAETIRRKNLILIPCPNVFSMSRRPVYCP